MPGNERVDTPRMADERTMLTAWLDWQRATLAGKCSGVTDGQLRERAVPPSTLSLLGLVRHMADVERSWFRIGVSAEAIAERWETADDEDAAFNEVDSASVDEAFAAWREEIAMADLIVDQASSLEVTFTMTGRSETSLRWLLVHMIEEYARHNGHADLLRERIDGRTGH